MHSALGRFIAAAVFVGCALSAQPSSAADLGLVTKAPSGDCSDLVFACENGRQISLCPIAVTVIGEVVTGSLHTGYGGTHVRLVPMGVGYRYAGHGVWLDGFRENAVLSYGKHSQVACTLLAN
jgi:hypothetical protein